MQFSVSCIAAILAFASSALAAPLEVRDNTSQKWELNKLVSFSPSGRPGSYPWSFIRASITDPNEINLGTSDADGKDILLAAGNQGLNCEAKWIRGESPLGRTWPCDAGEDGWWTMKVLSGGSSDGFTTTNFNLVFTRVAEVAYLGSKYSKTFEGEAHFERSTNGNLSGSCGGSGVCSWGLKSELVPYPIEQHEVTGSS